MKRSIFSLTALVAALAASTSQATPVSVTFDSLPTGVADPLGTYSEAGFTMTSADLGGSNVFPGLFESVVTVPAAAPGISGTMDVVQAGNAVFSFTSLDFQSANTALPSAEPTIRVEGFLGGVSQGIDLFANGTIGYLTFYAVNLSGKTVDYLKFTLANSPSQSGTGPQLNGFVLDNSPASGTVPEPGTALLFGIGLSGLLARKCRLAK